MAQDKIGCGVDILGDVTSAVILRIYDEKVNCIGVSSRENDGIEKREIVNLSKFATSIEEVVRDAEEMSGMEIDSVHVNIGDINTETLVFKTPEIKIGKSGEVTGKDIEGIKELANEEFLNRADKRELISFYPQAYFVKRNGKDSLELGENILGRRGDEVSAEYFAVRSRKGIKDDIKKAVDDAGLKLLGITYSPFADMENLNEEQRKDGGLLIKVGDDLADLTLFKGNRIFETKTVVSKGKYIKKMLADWSNKIITEYTRDEAYRFGDSLRQDTCRLESVFRDKIWGSNMPVYLTGELDIIKWLIDEDIIKGYESKIVMPSPEGLGVVRNPLYSTSYGLALQNLREQNEKNSILNKLFRKN